MAIRIGNNGANTLNGTNASDLIYGLGGDDVINAGGGNDLVFAGAGNDQIFAGNGNDWVYAGTGNDSAYGGNGNDFLFGEAGNDVLDGGAGSDYVDGGSGSDNLIFTDAERGGIDRYVGGSGQDSLVLEFVAARWADPAVKAEVRAYVAFLANGGTGNFTFTTMNLTVSSLETLVVKVDGAIIDPLAGGNTAPSGAADSYTTGENGILTVSPANERGTLVDNDNTGGGAFTVELVTNPVRGSLVLNADGTFSFNPGTAFDYLAAGQSAVETFTYRIVNSAGASQPITVTLNIAGANDAAVITGSLAGAVAEDADNGEGTPIQASGQIIVTDSDSGQSVVANPGSYAGTYGIFVLQANGTWVYTLNNALASVQALGEGDSVVETFPVTSRDGSAIAPVTITINGSNDVPVVSGDLSGFVSEDQFSLETEALDVTITGQIDVADVDAGESGMAAAGAYVGLYGTLTLAANGTWSYTLNNDLAAVQALPSGEQVFDVFDLTTIDGTPVTVSVTVQGNNDAPEIGGNLTGRVNEDGSSSENEGGTLTASGQIDVTDIDTGESGFAAVGEFEGVYGSLNLSDDGSWTYTLNNELVSVQSLRANEQVSETIAVRTADGTIAEVVILVEGVNDAAEINGNLDGTIVLAFEQSSVDGTVLVSDPDHDENDLVPVSLQGMYGDLVLQADGYWTYELDGSNPLPFDEATTMVTESFGVETVGGDGFAITISIYQDFLIPS